MRAEKRAATPNAKDEAPARIVHASAQAKCPCAMKRCLMPPFSARACVRYARYYADAGATPRDAASTFAVLI